MLIKCIITLKQSKYQYNITITDSLNRFLGGDYAEVNIRDFHHRLYLRDLPERNSTVCDKIKNKVKDFATGKKKIDSNGYRKFYDCLEQDCQSEIILEIKIGNQTTTVNNVSYG